MKREGFILIFVVVILGFLGVVALYSMERMRLAILIEENRIHQIREQTQEHNALEQLLLAVEDRQVLELVREHLKSPRVHSSGEYATVLHLPDGRKRDATVHIDTPTGEICWDFTLYDSDSRYQVRQNFDSVFQTAKPEDALSLDEKMAWVTEAFNTLEEPVLISESSLYIKLSASKSQWEVFAIQDPEPEVPETEELPTEEPPTEDPTEEPGPEDPPVEDPMAEDPLLEDPPEEPALEDPPGEDPITEEPLPEDPPEEPAPEVPLPEEPKSEPEVPKDPILTGPIHTIPESNDRQTRILCGGNVHFDARERPGASRFYATLCVEGDLLLERTTIQGIVLQRGQLEGRQGAQISGLYESKDPTNLEGITYHPNLVVLLRSGMDLPGFIRIHTKGTFQAPPEQYEDP